MNKLSNFGKIIRKNRSYILSFLGISGFIFGTVNMSLSAYKAGKEKRKIALKDILLTALIDVASSASILTGNVLDSRDKKRLAAGYILLAAVQQRYLNNKNEAVDSIAKQAAKDLKLGENIDEYHYFHDPISDQVFYTDMKTVLGAEFLVNRQLSIFGVVNAEDWPYFLGIEVTDDNAINIIDKGWDASIIDEFFQSPGIEFAHVQYYKDYICTLPDGSIQRIPKEDILEIVMSVYPKDLSE